MSSEKSRSFLADFGINSVVVLSKSIADATDAYWKYNHTVPESLISISLLLSAGLLGSIYVFSTALIGLNKKWIKDEKFGWTPFEFINGAIMLGSGVVLFITANNAIEIIRKK
jgi:hypothetical protein